MNNVPDPGDILSRMGGMGVLAFTQVEKPCEVPSGLDFRAFADGLCGQGKS